MTGDAQQPQEAVTAPTNPPSELAGEVLPVPVPVAEPASTSRSATQLGVNDDALSNARQEFTRHVHGYVNDYIRFADEKAGVAATFASAMLAFLHTQDLLPTLGFLDISLVGFCRFLAPAGLGLSILLAMWVVLPQRGGNQNSLVFWGAIAARPSSEVYESSLRAASRAGLESELVRHTHEISAICRTKYQRLAWAMYVGFAGIVASVGLLLLDRR